ncbi:MAG TPA: response regulator [Syntrophales bacterium]
MLENVLDIILVEDNPDDVELTLDALKTHKLSNRVKVLRDGEEALDYFFGTGKYADRDVCDRPKVILLDLKLPKVDGLEVLRRIRSDERTKTLPVVVLTSSNEQKDRIESYQLGVNSYIVKPVEFDSFARAVAQIGFYWVLLNKVPF